MLRTRPCPRDIATLDTPLCTGSKVRTLRRVLTQHQSGGGEKDSRPLGLGMGW